MHNTQFDQQQINQCMQFCTKYNILSAINKFPLFLNSTQKLIKKPTKKIQNFQKIQKSTIANKPKSKFQKTNIKKQSINDQSDVQKYKQSYIIQTNQSCDKSILQQNQSFNINTFLSQWAIGKAQTKNNRNYQLSNKNYQLSNKNYQNTKMNYQNTSINYQNSNKYINLVQNSYQKHQNDIFRKKQPPYEEKALQSYSSKSILTSQSPRYNIQKNPKILSLQKATYEPQFSQIKSSYEVKSPYEIKSPYQYKNQSPYQPYPYNKYQLSSYQSSYQSSYPSHTNKITPNQYSSPLLQNMRPQNSIHPITQQSTIIKNLFTSNNKFQQQNTINTDLHTRMHDNQRNISEFLIPNQVSTRHLQASHRSRSPINSIYRQNNSNYNTNHNPVNYNPYNQPINYNPSINYNTFTQTSYKTSNSPRNYNVSNSPRNYNSPKNNNNRKDHNSPRNCNSPISYNRSNSPINTQSCRDFFNKSPNHREISTGKSRINNSRLRQVEGGSRAFYQPSSTPKKVIKKIQTINDKKQPNQQKRQLTKPSQPCHTSQQLPKQSPRITRQTQFSNISGLTTHTHPYITHPSQLNQSPNFKHQPQSIIKQSPAFKQQKYLAQQKQQYQQQEVELDAEVSQYFQVIKRSKRNHHNDIIQVDITQKYQQS